MRLQAAAVHEYGACTNVPLAVRVWCLHQCSPCRSWQCSLLAGKVASVCDPVCRSSDGEHWCRHQIHGTKFTASVFVEMRQFRLPEFRDGIRKTITLGAKEAVYVWRPAILPGFLPHMCRAVRGNNLPWSRCKREPNWPRQRPKGRIFLSRADPRLRGDRLMRLRWVPLTSLRRRTPGMTSFGCTLRVSASPRANSLGNTRAMLADFVVFPRSGTRGDTSHLSPDGPATCGGGKRAPRARANAMRVIMQSTISLFREKMRARFPSGGGAQVFGIAAVVTRLQLSGRVRVKRRTHVE